MRTEKCSDPSRRTERRRTRTERDLAFGRQCKLPPVAAARIHMNDLRTVNVIHPRSFRTALHCVPLILTALLFPHSADAQHSLHATVVDSATAEPLVGASVLLMNTTRTTTTDIDGKLALDNIPDGPQLFHFASLGYRVQNILLKFPRSDAPITVKLVSEAEELEEVVITATRTNSRIDDAPQKIEVLGAEELEEEGSLKPGNVASLIGDISSVQIQQTSAVSGASAVRMQGLDGRHTLLLRDGMPAFGGLSGGFDLLRIPPLDLQRVELLKGPSSTFNGGGAIAGAINFVSKDPADSLGGMLLLNRASLSETNANVYVSGPLGKVGFTLFGGATMQDARDVEGDGYSDVPEARTYILHPRIVIRASKNDHLRVGASLQDDHRTGGTMTAIDAPDDTAHFRLATHGERIGGDLNYDHVISKTSDLTVKGAVNAYRQTDHDNFAGVQRTQENQYVEAFWKNHTDRRTWVIGANDQASQLHGGDLDAQSLNTLGLFTQLALHRTRWPEIDLGLRADAPAGYAVQVLPSAAALFKVNDRISLRANAGSGYQLPDRSRNYGLVYEGVLAQHLASNAVPERSLGGTVEWTWKKPLAEHTVLFIDQTFFATHISDPLAIATGSDGATMLANANGSTLTQGIDNYVRLTIEETELYVGYTWTLPQSTHGTTTTVIPYTPQHRAAMTLSHAFNQHWRAGIEASWSGEQERGDGTRTRDQLFMAAMVGYKAGHFTVVLNGENITDTRQTRWERIVSGTASRPVFAPLWAPIDGRVINLSVLYTF